MHMIIIFCVQVNLVSANMHVLNEENDPDYVGTHRYRSSKLMHENIHT